MGQKLTTRKQDNLIYDVGMHKGEDTDFYLKKGFKVIGFEADPQLAAQCRTRFSHAIAQGKLHIIEGAISENAEGPKTKFYRNVDHSPWGTTNLEWSKLTEMLGTRNEMVEVPAIDFKHCLSQYGIPYYLKADIVGSELICLRALLGFENKPSYVSIRSEKVNFRDLENEIDLLDKLGYSTFKAVQQDVWFQQTPDESREGEPISHVFEEGSSGLFGQDLNGRWKNKNEILRDYVKIFVLYRVFGDHCFLRRFDIGRRIILQLERLVRRPLPGWYDTHAKHSVKVITALCVDFSIH
jgi:FkbM family methyltransferase